MSMQEFSDNLSTLSYMSRHRIPSWLYDSKSKALFGRTGKSWVLCLLFYATYYACLAAFFTGLLWLVLYFNVPEDHPARTGKQSLLDFKPGLGLRPTVEVQKSMIKFSTGDPQTYFPHVDNIDAFLQTYKDVNAKPDSQFASCKGKDADTKDVDKVCKFSLENLGPCNNKNSYGYSKGTPCVLLKLNKVYGWMPSPEDSSVSNDILVNCSGQNPADDENIGPVAYYPNKTVKGITYEETSTTLSNYFGITWHLRVSSTFQDALAFETVVSKGEITSPIWNANISS
uniref:Sodium/potassium-transporting ATPase subunit beta n=1 Tax=Trichobilharzia regenti TaxID=157069 RepID=A0AA85K290_TRIRE|nr:unnamed protein product [Trichobilharzia regenti]